MKSEITQRLVKGEKQLLLSQLGGEKQDRRADGAAAIGKLQEQLRSVESRLKAQSLEQKKREDAMSLIKRDSSRCKELESNIESVLTTFMLIAL